MGVLAKLRLFHCKRCDHRNMLTARICKRSNITLQLLHWIAYARTLTFTYFSAMFGMIGTMYMWYKRWAFMVTLMTNCAVKMVETALERPSSYLFRSSLGGFYFRYCNVVSCCTWVKAFTTLHCQK